MKNIGTVVENNGENAVIKVKRISACDACEGKAACEGSLVGECAKSAEVFVTADNSIKAKVGDTVEFQSSTAMTLGIAFCVFILPLVAGFAAYFVAQSYFGDTSFVPYGISLAAFAVFFAGLFFGIDAKLKGKVNVKIARIIDSGNDNV